MKIRKIVMGKGVTRKVPGTENDFDKRYLEVTFEPPEQHTDRDLQEALVSGECFIDNWILQPETPQIPELDIAEINSLHWKKRNKEPAEPGEFAWLFGPDSRSGTEAGAEQLVSAIERAGGTLVLGDMEFALVKDGVFIQRKPVKIKK